MTRVSVQTEPRSPLAFPAYRRVFFARAVSSAGSYMQVVAASWLVYHLTNSAIAVGVLTSLALGPALVGGPIGGVLADRYDPRRLAILLSALQALACMALVVLELAGHLTVGLLYACVFAGAIPFSINQPIITLIVPYTVPEESRHTAVARASMIFNVTRLLGAFVGGVLVTAVGVAAAFGINALSYVLVTLVLWRTTLMISPDDTLTVRRTTGVVAGMRQGLGHPLMRVVALSVVLFFTLVAPLEQLMPTVAREHGMTATSVGVLVGFIGVGALVANPLLGKRNRSRSARQGLMAVGLAISAVGLVLLAVTPNNGILIDVIAVMAVGFGWEFVFVSGQGTVALDIPADIRGRMMGVFFLLVTATTALGALAIGYLFDTVGLTITLLTNAAIVALGAVVMAVRSRTSAGAA